MVSSHENVIRYVSMRVNMDEVFQIFLEYAGGGELFDQIGQCVLEFLKTEIKCLKTEQPKPIGRTKGVTYNTHLSTQASPK